VKRACSVPLAVPAQARDDLRPMRRLPARPALLAALLAGCTAPPPAVPPPRALLAADFPGAAALLTGFDERTDGPWTSGDAVLFGLRLHKAQQEHRWLLHLSIALGEELVGRLGDDEARTLDVLWGKKVSPYTAKSGEQSRDLEIESRMLPVRATVHDAEGKVLGASTVVLPADLLRAGMLPAVDAALAQPPGSPETLDPKTMEPFVRALLGLMSLFGVVQEGSVLRDYFWQVVEKPSVWSLATKLGVEATLSAAFEKSLPASELPPGLPALGRGCTIPLRIEVNGAPALLADVLAVTAARPYSLCGGMVAATARHPSRPDLQFDIALLAARCGTASSVALQLAPK